MAVSRSRVTVAVGAVLLWALTPVLACLLPCLANASAKQRVHPSNGDALRVLDDNRGAYLLRGVVPSGNDNR